MQSDFAWLRHFLVDWPLRQRFERWISCWCVDPALSWKCDSEFLSETSQFPKGRLGRASHRNYLETLIAAMYKSFNAVRKVPGMFLTCVG